MAKCLRRYYQTDKYRKIRMQCQHTLLTLQISLHKNGNDKYCYTAQTAIANLVVDDHTFNNCFVQHLLVPVLQMFGLRYLHVRRVAVENIIITLTGWTCAYVRHSVTGKRNLVKMTISQRLASMSNIYIVLKSHIVKKTTTKDFNQKRTIRYTVHHVKRWYKQTRIWRAEER